MGDMCMGSFFCLSWFPQVLQTIQEAAQFQSGECLCIHVGSFPFQWGSRLGHCPWQIIDAKDGVIARGKLGIEVALNIASSPSACEMVDPLLGQDEYFVK